MQQFDHSFSVDPSKNKWHLRLFFVLFFGVLLGGFIGTYTLLGGQIFPASQDLHAAALHSDFSDEKDVDVTVFYDVMSSDAHADVLAVLKNKGLIHGYEDGTFHPDEVIQRADFLQMLTTTLRIYPHHLRYSYCYEDVQEQWFSSAVCFASAKGWLKGIVEGGSFKPSHSVSQVDALVITSRAVGVRSTLHKNIFDAVAIADENAITRGEAAAIMYYVLLQERPSLLMYQ